MVFKNYLKYFNAVLFSGVLFSVSNSYAANLELAWDANIEPDLAGYNVYSSSVTQPIFVGKQTTATVSNLVVGSTYQFTVTALSTNDLESLPSGTISYTVPSVPTTATNKAPVVSAGTSQSVRLPNNASLKGAFTDDGLPNPPGKVTVTWSKVSGRGTVTFANPVSAITTAAFSIRGTYVLRLTAFDGALRTISDVTINVSGKGTSTLATTAAVESDATTSTLSAKVSAESVAPVMGSTNVYTIPMNTAPFMIPFTMETLSSSAVLVSAQSSNQRVVTNDSIVVSFDGAQRMLKIAPATNETGTTRITVTMKDGTKTAVRYFDLVIYNAIENLEAISSLDAIPDAPKLRDTQRTDTYVQLHWVAKTGLRFAVESSADLITWTAHSASVTEATPGDYVSQAYLRNVGFLYFRVREIQTAELPVN